MKVKVRKFSASSDKNLELIELAESAIEKLNEGNKANIKLSDDIRIDFIPDDENSAMYKVLIKKKEKDNQLASGMTRVKDIKSLATKFFDRYVVNGRR